MFYVLYFCYFNNVVLHRDWGVYSDPRPGNILRLNADNLHSRVSTLTTNSKSVKFINTVPDTFILCSRPGKASSGDGIWTLEDISPILLWIKLRQNKRTGVRATMRANRHVLHLCNYARLHKRAQAGLLNNCFLYKLNKNALIYNNDHFNLAEDVLFMFSIKHLKLRRHFWALYWIILFNKNVKL